MMKRISALLLCLLLVLSMAVAEESETPGYEVVYSSENPIPEIAEQVRPAVVQVLCYEENWDATTRIASTDLISAGSGCYIRAIDNGGYILTNNHIIDAGEVFKIQWLSGEEMEVDLMGVDDGTDIAVLRFNEAAPEGVSPIPLGDSDELRIGELAICIGNPGAGEDVLPGTVTAGIVSGLAREDISADNNFTRSTPVIQIDAAINTGNSGGALLNAKGELVGIPTLKLMYTSSVVYEGIGFCIPINTIKDYIDQLIDDGSVVRPRLGITVADIDGPDEAMKKYPPAGAQVYTVEEKGPSDVAGLQVGDVITEINGVRVKNYSMLLKELDKCAAGDRVELKIYRYYDKDGNLTGSYEELYMSVQLALLD